MVIIMNNKHSPFTIYNLNPGLVTEVNRAYQRNVEAGRVVSDEFTDGVAVESLADVLHQKGAVEANGRSEMSGILFQEIENQETLAQFESAFRDTARLFDRIGEGIPRPEDFESIGVDFGELAKKYELMQQYGREPQIVIAPHRESFAVWVDLYDALMKDDGLKWSYARDDNELSIYIGDGVLKAWKDLNMAYDANPYLPTLRTEAAGTMKDEWVGWSVRLIPTAKKPDGLTDGYDADGGVHPTVTEYLTLQALRIQSNQKPIGGDEILWLQADPQTPSIAPTGYYQYGQRKICIGMNHKDNNMSEHWTRRPRW